MGLLAVKRRIPSGMAAQLVVLSGGMAVAVGIGAALTWPAGLMAGGVEAVAYGLFLMDTGGQ